MNGSPLRTLKDVAFTQESIKALLALTYETVDIVCADGTVHAGMTGALVHVSLTVHPLKTRRTLTREAPNTIQTSASITAWVYRGERDFSL